MIVNPGPYQVEGPNGGRIKVIGEVDIAVTNSISRAMLRSPAPAFENAMPVIAILDDGELVAYVATTKDEAGRPGVDPERTRHAGRYAPGRNLHGGPLTDAGGHTVMAPIYDSTTGAAGVSIGVPYGVIDATVLTGGVRLSAPEGWDAAESFTALVVAHKEPGKDTLSPVPLDEESVVMLGAMPLVLESSAGKPRRAYLAGEDGGMAVGAVHGGRHLVVRRRGAVDVLVPVLDHVLDEGE